MTGQRDRSPALGMALATGITIAACTGSGDGRGSGADPVASSAATTVTETSTSSVDTLVGHSAEELLAMTPAPNLRECLVTPSEFVFDPTEGFDYVHATVADVADLELFELDEPRRTFAHTGHAVTVGQIEWATAGFDPNVPAIYPETRFEVIDDVVHATDTGFDPHPLGVPEGAEVLLLLGGIQQVDGESVRWIHNVAVRGEDRALFAACGPALEDGFDLIAGQLDIDHGFDAALAVAMDPDRDAVEATYSAAREQERIDQLEARFFEADPRTRSVIPSFLAPSLYGTWTVQPTWVLMDDLPDVSTIVIRTATGVSVQLPTDSLHLGTAPAPLLFFPGDDTIEIVLDGVPPTGGEVLAEIPITDLSAALVVRGTVDQLVVDLLDEEAALELSGHDSLDELYSMVTPNR